MRLLFLVRVRNFKWFVLSVTKFIRDKIQVHFLLNVLWRYRRVYLACGKSEADGPVSKFRISPCAERQNLPPEQIKHVSVRFKSAASVISKQYGALTQLMTNMTRGTALNQEPRCRSIRAPREAAAAPERVGCPRRHPCGAATKLTLGRKKGTRLKKPPRDFWPRNPQF